jgi:hypothetical protein
VQASPSGYPPGKLLESVTLRVGMLDLPVSSSETVAEQYVA